MRSVLGWSLRMMASVINITPGQYSIMESKKRPIPAHLQEPLQKIHQLAEIWKKKQSVSIPTRELSAETRAKLQRHINNLEFKLLNTEEKNNRVTRKTPKAQKLEFNYAEQLALLEKLDAHITMRRALHSMVLKQRIDQEKYNPITLHLSKAYLIGKKAEIEYLKRVLKNPDTKKTKK
jgi:hypothetical protein